MADSIIVGQFVGSSALAAVGACAALTNVFICVALGAGVGAGVLVSRYFGAEITANENDCVDIFDQLSHPKHTSWCIRLSFFPSDDETFTNAH